MCLRHKIHILAIGNRFCNREWVLDWSTREANLVTDKAAKLSLDSNVSFSFDEDSTREIPSVLLDCLLADQFSSGLSL